MTSMDQFIGIKGIFSDTGNLIQAEKFHEVITELIFNEKLIKTNFIM